LKRPGFDAAPFLAEDVDYALEIGHRRGVPKGAALATLALHDSALSDGALVTSVR
jgi:hypothetical protein